MDAARKSEGSIQTMCHDDTGLQVDCRDISLFSGIPGGEKSGHKGSHAPKIECRSTLFSRPL